MLYPDIDPIALDLGALKIRWYGLMYLVGFGAGWWLGRYRARQPSSGWQASQIDDLVFFAALGIVLGGRVGYALFYGYEALIDDPLRVLRIWEGGMSFHGGFIGVLLAMGWFARKYQMTFFEVTDFLAPLVPIGLLAGRLGNFINGELWGAPGTVPWAMQVPCEQLPALCFSTFGVDLGNALTPPLHPTQLYEAALEGVVLFALLWWFSATPRPRMAVSALFLIAYGGFRFLVEFLRMPDAHIGYLAFDWLTMGQILSVPMIVVGAILLALAYRKEA